MEKLAALPIDWTNVSWDYVIALVLLVMVAVRFRLLPASATRHTGDVP
jgi:hypothetical protein